MKIYKVNDKIKHAEEAFLVLILGPVNLKQKKVIYGIVTCYRSVEKTKHVG